MLCLFVEWTIKVLCIVKGRSKDHENRHGYIPKRITSSRMTKNVLSGLQGSCSRLGVQIKHKQSLGIVYALLVRGIDD